MNFLAHLHIADHCHSSLLGNLLGDFVKGDPAKIYGVELASGIRLHRSVDSYTDNHDIIKQCKALFAPEKRRFAPIALDMFWDHCLAKHWQHYHVMPLCDFVDNAHRDVTTPQEVDAAPLPERFLRMSEFMWRDRWLESYQELDNIQYALERMSQRSLRMEPLAECGVDLELNYQRLSNLFTELYPQVLLHARYFSQTNP
ncbi:ACP phosphodiesterase [Vibrio cionasavignyae]|uniref:acyl carrier protein phosphodiesterase n=1 Tax=Vibrio cionasavignyae TaxID=2910252 RepID=UPI003D12D474